MDELRESERRTYVLCRLGFALLSVALVVASLSTIIITPAIFQFRPLVPGLLSSPVWRWSDTPVVFGSLIGVYLLRGRWPDPNWQRRSGLLLIMCVADLLLWFVDHGEALGLRLDDFGHDWLRSQFGQALGWAEFALIASLSCDVLAHLGVARAVETGRATRSLAATGAVIWLLHFVQYTNWNAGWPLDHKPRWTFETFLLFLGTHLIFTITLIQVTALTIAAARQCSVEVDQIDREDREHDLLRLPSEAESFPGFEDEINKDNPYRAPLNW